MSVHDEVVRLIATVMDRDDRPDPPTIRLSPAAIDVLKAGVDMAHDWPTPDRLCGIPINSDPTMPIGAWEIIHAGTIRTGNVFGDNPPTSPGRVIYINGDIYWVSDAVLADIEIPRFDYTPPLPVDPTPYWSGLAAHSGGGSRIPLIGSDLPARRPGTETSAIYEADA